MSKAFEILKRGALYAVIISFVVYVLGFSTIASAGMPWHRFLTIVLYGILISFSQWLDSVLPLKNILKTIINFTIDLLGFVAVYLVVTGVDNFNVGRFFILLGFFTVCYVVIALVAKLFNKIMNTFAKSKPDTAPAPKKEEPVYRPRYTDEE